MERLGALAIVIIGHERCGVVSSAVSDVQQRMDGNVANSSSAMINNSASHVGDLLTHISPAVQASLTGFRAAGSQLADISTDDLVEAAMRMNVALTAKSMTDRSPLIYQRVREGRLAMAGFRYDIDSPADADGNGELIVIHGKDRMISMHIHPPSPTVFSSRYGAASSIRVIDIFTSSM